MPYYRVEGEYIEYVDDYVKAENKYKAIEEMEYEYGNKFDDVSVQRVTKKEFEENKL